MSHKIEIYYIHKFDICDRGHFMIIKGISVLAALVAYCCSIFLNYTGLNVLQHIATAVFMLCSGFGLSASYERKGGLPHYWENRFMRVWIPSLIALLICYLIEMGNPIGWIGRYPIALKGDFFRGNLLYLVFANYLAFWLVFSFFDKKGLKIAALFTIAIIAFFAIENAVIRRQVFCFPTGVLISQMNWKRKLRKASWKGKLFAIVITAALTAGSWILAERLQTAYVPDLLWSLSYMSAAICLGIFVYAAQAAPVFGIFAPFGYGAYIMFLVHKNIYKLVDTGDWRSFAVISAALFVIGLIGAWVTNRLFDMNKNVRRRRRTHLKGSMR